MSRPRVATNLDAVGTRCVPVTLDLAMLAQDAREHARRLLGALLMTVALRLGRLRRMVGRVGGGIVVHVGQREKARVKMRCLMSALVT